MPRALKPASCGTLPAKALVAHTHIPASMSPATRKQAFVRFILESPQRAAYTNFGRGAQAAANNLGMLTIAPIAHYRSHKANLQRQGLAWSYLDQL
jgi:hypothetical protein